MSVSEHPNLDTVQGTDSQKAVNETLEDYTLRYAPHSFRRWSPKLSLLLHLVVLPILLTFLLVPVLVCLTEQLMLFSPFYLQRLLSS